jgi:hypothetical protein
VMVLLNSAMKIASHAGDDVAGVTCPWRDVYNESCWRQC